MSTQLEQNLQNILNQKNTYLTPNNIRSGVSALGITGTYIPPIKMYPTREAMLADTTEPQNEYGVVYGEKVQPLTEGMIVQGLLCANTVTLDDEITENTYWSPDAEDLAFNIELGPTSCRIMYIDYDDYDGRKQVEYTSSDGIHYTTSATLEQRTITLKHNVKMESRWEDWNNAFPEFMQSYGKYFEGMYEYVTEKDDEWYDAITGYNITGTTITSDNEETYLPFLAPIMKNLNDEINTNVGETMYGYVYTYNGNIYFQQTQYRIGINPNDATKVYMPITSSGSSNTKPLFLLDMDTMSFEFVSNTSGTFNAGSYSWKEYNMENINIIGGFTNGIYSDEFTALFYAISNGTVTNIYGNYTDDCEYGHVEYLTWHHVKTEFTLELANQLYPGVTALGAHGPVTGSDAIWDNIPLDKYYSLLGLHDSTPTSVYYHGLYGDYTDYISNVYDNDKLVYLTKASNGSCAVGKPVVKQSITYNLGPNDSFGRKGILFNDTNTYAAGVQVTSVYTTTWEYTYVFKVWDVENDDVIYTRTMDGAANYMGFYNNIVFLSDEVNKCIYTFDCDNLTWSTYSSSYNIFLIYANKYIILPKYNNTSSTTYQEIKIINLATNAEWTVTETGRQLYANNNSELPLIFVDGDNLYGIWLMNGASTATNYLFITPTSCTKVAGEKTISGFYSYTVDKSHRGIKISSNELLCAPRNCEKLIVFNTSNNTVSTINAPTGIHPNWLNFNEYGQIVSMLNGITIWEPSEFSIVNNTLVLDDKAVDIPDVVINGGNTTMNWISRRPNIPDIRMDNSLYCWHKADGKITYTCNNHTEDQYIAFSYLPMEIVFDKYTKSYTKPNDMTDVITMINANARTDPKTYSNPIVFGDNSYYTNSLETSEEILGE